MSYFGTSINESPVIVGIAGAAITNGDCKAVKFVLGKVVPCSVAGEASIGVLLPGTGAVAIGDDVTVQIKDIGLGKAGGDILIGDNVAVNANGDIVQAQAGNFIIGTAFEAGASGKFVKFQITKTGFSPAATEITAFDSIANVAAGKVGALTYANATAVKAALPTAVSANSGTIYVPVTAWVDTDTYNGAAAASYTFTATLGTLPAGIANTGNKAATVEVVVAVA